VSSTPKQKPSQAHGLRYPFETLPEPGDVIEVAPGVLWVRMSLPYTLDHINLWLLEDGDGWTVVDTCVDMDIARQQWETLFAGVMGGKPIKNVIVTHMHPDHVGLAGWLVKRFDASFYMSRTDYLMCRAMAADTGRKAPEEAMRFYRAAGFSEEGLARYQTRFGGFGEHIHELPQAYRRLQQGQELKIGGRVWRVEVGSGHAPEHICLNCEDLNVLISGDQVIPRISSNVSLFPTEPFGNPLQDWIDSCARIKGVLPSDTLVLPAHNEPFYGLHERLTALIEGHEKSLSRLLDVCTEPRRAVDKEVFSSLFKRKIGPDVFFMATGESLSHLMCLVHRGDLEMNLDDGGVCYFSRSAA
jgi:glyoxylase-like metal-dependent hydrolase (beta-lactamase superfamily II)